MKRVTRLMLAACLASLATPALADAFADAHRSIVAGDVDSAMLGITMGAFAVNARDETGNTLLHYAAQIGSAEAVAALLDRGADPAMKNAKGETAAMLAATPAIRAQLEATHAARS